MTATPCPACRRPFTAHIAVRARCKARWRGKSFDADAARGAVGLAALDAYGVDPRDGPAVDALLARVIVKAHRTVQNVNPDATFDPEGEPEWWEFHVGFVDAVDAERVARVEGAALAAVAKARNFIEAEVVR